MDDIRTELTALRHEIAILKAERECAAVLARYGFYADHGRRAEWLQLFTEDAVFDLVSYDPSKPVDARWLHRRLVGHDQLGEIINGPVHERIEGRSQHQMGGPPAIFRLIDDTTAVMVTYSVVYAKGEDLVAPLVQLQSHSMNRWTFRRSHGAWFIAEDVRRPMGSPESASLFGDF